VAVDARVDDFEGIDDPNFTGWHRLEYILFEQNTTDGAVEYADKLDADLRALRDGLADLEIPLAAVPIGASELVEEVSLGKITGEENRYSNRDWWDINANIEGSQAVVDALRPALEERAPDLLADLDAQFAEVEQTYQPFAQGNGWRLYCLENPLPEFANLGLCEESNIPQDVTDALQAQTAALSELTSQIAGALGLE
jgi:iron uptake system component EfeO